MRRILSAIAIAAFALVLAPTASGAPLAAPTSVATKMQLHGHLPDLGETPAMWVFLTASSYDSFRVQYNVADVMPPSGSLYMTFDKELLALYTRGNDDGGRCLRSGSTSAIVGASVVLDLAWDSSECGAPASAHYPFVLVSLSRAADDGSAWMSGRQVCATAPGIDASRACAPAAGAAASPSPSSTSTPSATPTPTPTATPTLSASATPSPSPSSSTSASPRTTAPATPTRSPSASPSTVVAGSSSQGGGPSVLDIVGWVAVGLIVGVFVTALVMRPRTYRV